MREKFSEWDDLLKSKYRLSDTKSKSIPHLLLRKNKTLIITIWLL